MKILLIFKNRLKFVLKVILMLICD